MDEVGVVMDEYAVEVGRQVGDGVKKGGPGKVKEEGGKSITLKDTIGSREGSKYGSVDVKDVHGIFVGVEVVGVVENDAECGV